MSAPPAESVFARLEPLLMSVSKPVQYVGGELNSLVKEWASCDVRWCLMYPDAYEVGLPNQGVQILYEVLGELDGVLVERTYSVWPDLEALMREHGIPQFTVDAHRPVGAFDIFGVSFSTELGYTNMLNALDLAGIPLESAERTEAHPIVIVGGHAAFNPEPIADFVDAAVLGDGEQAVLAITAIVRAWKLEGSPGGRDELLYRLAITGNIYVPRFYDVTYRSDGHIDSVVPNREGVPARVSKHTLMDLDAWPYPKKPLVPLAETVHERFSVEIFRGCTRGCRFCQAGMITRPVRERSVEQRRPLRDRPARQATRRPLRGNQHLIVAAINPGRCLQRRPGERILPQRQAFRAHIRTRGWQRAYAQGHQQDGDRRRPDPHGNHCIRTRLAPGEAVLHVRIADRDRRRRAADR
jgi:hypothetical protein